MDYAGFDFHLKETSSAVDAGTTDQAPSIDIEQNPMNIVFHNGTSRVATLDIQVSTNGSSWTTVVNNGQSSGATNGFQEFTFTATNAQFVRFVGYGDDKNDWNGLTGVEILVSQ